MTRSRSFVIIGLCSIFACERAPAPRVKVDTREGRRATTATRTEPVPAVPEPPAMVTRPPAVPDPLALIQADLRAEPDARVAIIRAYGRFERALAAARAPRAAWQTPAEFMRTTLARLPVPAAPVRRLTALFEVARFSTHPLGAEARDAACDSLDEIGTALEEDAARER